MNKPGKEVTEVEMHCIELKYVHLRLPAQSNANKMITSIKEYGQLVPITVVPEGKNRWILIDGYLRVSALQHLGRDTVQVEIWHCDEVQALLFMFTEKQSRSWEVIEESLLLRELGTLHCLSQENIAKHIGRSQSWISYRLSLIAELPESILASVMSGNISLWTATRILGPIARAIPSHAEALTNYLHKNNHSTREVQKFYDHYNKSNKQVRVNMANQPELFFKSYKLDGLDKHAQKLKNGPEGKWKQWLNIINSLVSQLVNICPEILYSKQPKDEQQALLSVIT